MSTVGYSIPTEISTTSKVVISLLIASGISIVFYALTSLNSLIVEGHFQDYVRKRGSDEYIQSSKKFPYVVCDAEEETLLSVGIEKAQALVFTLLDGTKNTFVILTARSLNPSLKIIARVSDQKTYNKLSYPERIRS